jgi:hypothetical protein
LLVAMAVALHLASGVAIACTVNCDEGTCRDTNSNDSMYGSHGRDNIRSSKGRRSGVRQRRQGPAERLATGTMRSTARYLVSASRP